MEHKLENLETMVEEAEAKYKAEQKEAKTLSILI
jgi:hypothetical protein